MKSSKFKERLYRRRMVSADLHSKSICIQETDLQVSADRPPEADYLKKRIRFYRGQIEDYIGSDRRFLTSLKPIPVELKSHPVIRRMAQAAKAANVGPMAAVAGAMAEFIGRDLLKRGCRQVIIENGGDIFLKVEKARKVAIYAGPKKAWGNLAIKIYPAHTPLGICTSSGVIGHSLSFGSADSVVVLSKNASLADAVATATCNRIRSKDDLRGALDFARSIRGISAVVVIFGDVLLSWGELEFC